MPSSPLVTVLVATHDAAPYLRKAVASILRQSVDDLELVVVDDASQDETPRLLEEIDDPRLVVLRNDENRGLATSLNSGLEVARGRYVARLDADDVALPERLERQLAVFARRSGLAVVGSATLEIDGRGAPLALHRAPTSEEAVRWRALFGSPFFHPTVMLDRSVLDRLGLRYDESLGESEDYDLWDRLLLHASGDNLSEPLVLRRSHPGQASRRRADLQRTIQLDVSCRAIRRVAPALDDREVGLAWRVGTGDEIEAGERQRAVEAYARLWRAFAAGRTGPSRPSRIVAARAVARAAGWDAELMREALVLDPLLLPRAAVDRVARRKSRGAAARRAESWLRAIAGADRLRVTVVSPEPTPYRSPLFDRIANRPEVELTVVYAARTVAGRRWDVVPAHRSVVLSGPLLPGARRLLRHDYPLTRGVASALEETRPDVVVVSGWSTLASQRALAWCRRHRVPYLLLVSSHDEGPRSGWRQRVRRAVVPRIVRGSSGALVLGTWSRESLVANGAAETWVFANTIDVPKWIERADRLAARRSGLREALGLEPDDVAVLSVARLAPEKGLDTLVRAVAEAGDERLRLVLVGDGPERESLVALARSLHVPLRLEGELGGEALAEAYVAADVFALLSRHEPWGVVVNEAAASGKPLVVSDRVGAGPDLVEHDASGFVVAADDAAAAGAALRELTDPDLRRRQGERSRATVETWGYEPSVEAFVEAVRAAARR